MRRALWCLAVVLGGCEGDDLRAPLGRPGGPPPLLSVVTYHLSSGVDLAAHFQPAAPAPAEARVARALEAVAASRPAERMDAVAAQIVRDAPDLVALQAAALWRTQSPADGTATPAETVAYDLVALLVDALARRGLGYDVAVEAPHTDVEATGSLCGARLDVRVTDRDALLIKRDADLRVLRLEAGTFKVNLPPGVVFETAAPARGWAAVDLDVAGRLVRVVNTHLEAAAEEVREAQAAELLLGPAATSPVVLLGAFHFTSGSASYARFLGLGLTEAGDGGPTCCRAADLRGETSPLSARLDFVFSRGGFTATKVRRLGAAPADRVRGLWPSDHAGVSAVLAPAR